MLEAWLQQFTQFGYLGIFIISFVGSVSVIFPIPYTLVIFGLGSVLDPVLIAISGGLGAALGEFSGYALGYYGTSKISEERRKKMDFMVKIFDKYGPVTIFLFALTPLPDDLLFIPLGVMRYSFLKAFIPAIIGKTLMTFIIAYSGQQSLELITVILGESGFLGTAITVVLLAIVIFAMIKIDWEKVFKKHVGSKD
ncbi:MAG: VTT domain-containing protein [Candidatus Bathyarchaeota archaeon]|nr:VTT domain-containing protein [Candidatus Bathyarchaeum tardum]WGM89378.1 MAG: VTT domain-containing protein [Candidatus Bathyarchaeum tardum]